MTDSHSDSDIAVAGMARRVPGAATSSGPSRETQLLVLSARTPAALEAATANLARYLDAEPGQGLADVAFTLQTRRQRFNQRRVAVCRDVADAVDVLRGGDPARLLTQAADDASRTAAFLFPGSGAQYPGMAAELYRTERLFREEVDRGLVWMRSQGRPSLEKWLYPREADRAAAAEQLERPSLAQPALLIVEYALARLWMSWGVAPTAMLGHSLGEYTAACLAGVFSLEDALRLVTARADLIDRVPGGMLAVPLPADEMRPLLGPGLAIAAINGPSLCAVSGSLDAVTALEKTLAARDVGCRRIPIVMAAHSPLLDPILPEYLAVTRAVTYQPPKLPFLSNVSGTWITAAEATDPAYWVKHLRETVRFADGLQELAKDSSRVLLEVGPGKALSTLARQHPARSPAQAVVASLRHREEQASDVAFLSTALGRLWLAGVRPDWSAFHAGEGRRRVSLPTYPVERQLMAHPTEPQAAVSPAGGSPVAGGQRRDLATPYAAPRDEEETKIAALWQEILGIDQVGIHDDFFDLGGHSLLLTRVVSRICKESSAEIPLRSLFDAPTVAGLAELVKQAKRGGASVPRTAITRLSRAAHRVKRSALDDLAERPVEREEVRTVS